MRGGGEHAPRTLDWAQACLANHMTGWDVCGWRDRPANGLGESGGSVGNVMDLALSNSCHPGHARISFRFCALRLAQHVFLVGLEMRSGTLGHAELANAGQCACLLDRRLSRWRCSFASSCSRDSFGTVRTLRNAMSSRSAGVPPSGRLCAGGVFISAHVIPPPSILSAARMSERNGVCLEVSSVPVDKGSEGCPRSLLQWSMFQITSPSGRRESTRHPARGDFVPHRPRVGYHPLANRRSVTYTSLSMARAQRKEQIEALERLRKRRVVVYITGDRQPNLGTQIAGDVFPMIYDLLSRIGRVPELDLFIYSTGGITMVAWGLINLLREFSASLSVLVPFRALSTATLIALGANEIVMSRLGQLSPVDPSVNTPFNPPAPQQPGASLQGFLPVSVEDVRGFLDLARDEAKLKDEQIIAGVFSQLATDVRPLALGNVHRAKEQIKMLTEQLLLLHIPEVDKNRVGPIVETFTRRLFSHDYLIGRQEAKRIIGPEVVDAPQQVEAAMMDLYSSYAKDLELSTIYNPEGALGKDTQKVVSFQRAYIESTDGCYAFKTVQEIGRIQVQQMPPVFGINVRLIQEGWTAEDC